MSKRSSYKRRHPIKLKVKLYDLLVDKVHQAPSESNRQALSDVRVHMGIARYLRAEAKRKRRREECHGRKAG